MSPERFVSLLIVDAGKTLKKNFKLANLTEKGKGEIDFVTDVDEQIDLFLREELAKKFPQSQFLTEETASEDYSALVNAKNLWVIDPLDGTTNFSRGRPHFGISIALVDKGDPKFAAVYLPIQNELYTATRYGKALLNGEEIHVSNTGRLQKAWIESGFSWDIKKRAEFSEKWIPILAQNVRAFTMSGCAVFNMAAVAKGEIDAFVYCGIKPWDQAAAGLIIQKAGGIITASDGSQWNVFTQDILAGNKNIHPLLLNLISKAP